MIPPKIPFNYGFFYYAMIGLLGRGPDFRHQDELTGNYIIRYWPKDDTEKNMFAVNIRRLHDWLNIFEITPLRSRCNFGRRLQPQMGEEGKDCLEIVIVHPVEKPIEKS